MRRFLSGAVAAALLAASPAGAVSLLSSTVTSPSTLTFYTLTGTEDLRNNAAPFTNGGPFLRGPFSAYLFDEGEEDGVRTFLLHYDRNGGLLSVGRVRGSFVLQLDPNEIWLGVADTMTDLLITDPHNGVRYQDSFATLADGVATTFRGVEIPDSYLVNFDAGLNQLTVTYDFTNDGAAQDQVRFGFATVPEPGAWALMIAGFGLAGAALRRRRALAAA